MAKAVYSDNFERLALKECYVCKYSNKDMSSVEKYRKNISQTAGFMYSKLRYKFDRVGYDVDDIKSISTYYALHYFGLYSIANNAIEREKFNNLKVKKTEFIAERNKLISFLRHKLLSFGEYCDRKSRNIVVGDDLRLFFANTESSKPASEDEILTNHKELGYRKVSQVEYKEVLKNRHGDLMVDSKGFEIIEINRLSAKPTAEECTEIFGIREGSFYRGPEEFVVKKEEEVEFQAFSNTYKNMPREKRVNMLNLFVRRHKGDSRYREELITAKKFLRSKAS